jgi:hypothetical protein
MDGWPGASPRANPPRASRPARKSRVFNFPTDAYMTNEFLIRDSMIFGNYDNHLAVPSNGFLTAVGYCSALLAPSTTIPEVRT